MVQIADSTQAAHCLNTRPDLDIFLRPFVPRNGTQRHCDHLEKLQPIQCNPRERKIECYEVGLFLEAAVSEVATYGYWEVDGRTCAGPTWTPIVRCETFELLVECPPGKRITLGNLDLVVILQSCLEDANGGAFMRKLASTSKCWPTGHVDFRWLLRGTWAEGGPPSRSGISSEVPRRKSVKQILSPLKRLSLDRSPEKGRTDVVQPTPSLAGDTALEVSESEETLSWWDMCLGDLTLAGAAPTFPEGASVFDTPAEATVTRFCLLRGDFLILVLQGFFEYGNVMIRNFRPHPEGGFEKPLALDCTTTPATLTKDTDVKMETTFRRNIFSWNSNMPLKI